MTNKENVNAAWSEILTSTISGAEWQNRVTNGYKGKPYNWQATAYGRAKLLLDQVADVPVVVSPPPPPIAVSPVARTNYIIVPNGGLDPLWAGHGRHMGAGCHIGVEADPLGGNFRVQRHSVVDGGVFSGGERAEVLNTDAIRTPVLGGRFQVGFKLLLPVGFRASGSDWNGLVQMHYSAPWQSPWMMGVKNEGDLFYRLLGGPLNGDGTMGTVRNEGTIINLSRGVWHTLCMDVKLDATDGIFDLWVDGAQRLNLRAPTLSPGSGNDTYWKQGFYRSQNDSGSNSYYFQDTLCWKNSSPDAMLAWFANN